MVTIEQPKLFLVWAIFIFSYPFYTIQAEEEPWHKVDYNNTVYDINVDATIPLGEYPLDKSDYESGKINHIRITPQLSLYQEVADVIFAAQTIRLLNEGISYHYAIAPGHRQEFPTERTDSHSNNYKFYALPGLEGYPPLVGGWLGLVYFDGLDNFEKRKSYYFSCLTQSILQPDRYCNASVGIGHFLNLN